MFNTSELRKCKNEGFSALSTFTDLREVRIDESKPIPERMESFFAQVKNPYLFKVGDVFVKVNYMGGKDLKDSLVTLLNNG